MFNRGEAHLWWTKHDDMLPLGFAPVFYLRLLVCFVPYQGKPKGLI